MSDCNKAGADYSVWNAALAQYFFAENRSGETIWLTVDPFTLQRVGGALGLPEDKNTLEKIYTNSVKEAVQKEYSFCHTKNGIPFSIALLCFQVYVVYTMQKDKANSFSASEYNPRLQKLLGLKSQADLQSFYREVNQEELWLNLKKWALGKGFVFKLPTKRIGRDRYIQYPKYHALLRKEDIDICYRLFYENGFLPGDEVEESDIESKIVGGMLSLPRISKRTRSLLEGEEHHEDVLGQITTELYLWNGEVPAEEEVDNTENTRYAKNKKAVVLQLRTSPEFDESEPNGYTAKKVQIFEVNPKTFVEIKEVFGDVFSHKRGELWRNRLKEAIIVFKYDTEEANTWIESDSLELDAWYCFLSDYTITEDFSGCKSYVPSNFPCKAIFVKIPGRYEDIPENIIKYFRKTPVLFEGGLKINDQIGTERFNNIWLKDAGPHIKALIPIDEVVINGKRYPFRNNVVSCRLFPVGRYTVRAQRFTKRFSIVQDSQADSFKSTLCGWNVARYPAQWNAKEEVPKTVISFFAEVSKGLPSLSSAREWINAALQIAPQDKEFRRSIKAYPAVIAALRRGHSDGKQANIWSRRKNDQR